MGRRKSDKPPKIRSVRQLKKSSTPRQSKFVEAFLKTRNKTRAALLAGYSPKNAAQAGYAVAEKLKEKAPEVFARMGLTLESVIQKRLVPLMEAQEVKFSQHEGEFTDFVEVDALPIQLGATRMFFELANAFPPRDPALAAQIGVEVIVNDMPRPHRPTVNVKTYLATQSGNGNKKKEPPAPAKNGDEPEDPRPKD